MTDHTTTAAPGETTAAGFEAYDSRPWLKHYTGLSKPNLDALPYKNFGDMVSQASREYAQQPAFTTMLPTGTSGTLTFAEVEQLTDQFAAYLRFELGLAKGDRVAIQSPNCLAYPIFLFGAAKAGCVIVNLNPLYTPPEIEHALTDSGAKLLLMIDMFADKLATVIPKSQVQTVLITSVADFFPPLRKFIVKTVQRLKKMIPEVPVPARPFTEAIKLGAKHLNGGRALPRDDVSLDDLLALQYTGGTTGRPKGAMLTHANLYANARQGEAWMHGAEVRREVFYAVLPMFHAFGMTLFMTFGVLKQGRIVLFPSFDVDMVLDAARKHPPTVYCAVPPIYEATARRAKERGISLRSARFCISGAMALPTSTVELWESVSGGLLVEGYGMTEASPVCLGNPFAPSRRPGTIGVPFPSTLMKVVDPDDPDREVPQGEPGELLVKGPQVFRGYWHNEEETRKTLTPDGWLRTGDVVTVDADGFTRIVDRVKELIITGGFNVSPTEVEQVLVTHPDIADAAVVGMPDGSGGERVTAAVLLDEGATIGHAELRAWCKERLAGYKVPREVYVVDELPRSMLGKVLRAKVREQLADLTPLPY